MMVIEFLPLALRGSLKYFGNQQAAGSSVDDGSGLMLYLPAEIWGSY